MIRPILRAQLLSMRVFRLGSARRGAVFSLVTALFWYGFWTLLAFAVEEYLAGPNTAAALPLLLPRGLLLVFLYWQLAPLLTASLGASLDLKKLLVYPVPRHELFVVEALLRLATCGEMLLVLAGGLIGLQRNPLVGSWKAFPRVACVLLLFIAFNVFLSAGFRSLLERLLARKRLREVLVLLLVLVTAAPRIMMASGFKLRALGPLLSFTESLFWPWAAAGSAVLGSRTLAAGAMLALWAVLAASFGMRQFRRSLRYDVQAAQATDLRGTRAAASGVERLYRLPAVLLPDPVAAIVEKELRSLVRTPRFRLVFIMGFSFGILVWLPLVMGRRAGRSTQLTENFVVLVSVYALTLLGQVSYWNAFGFDRTAAQVYFASPVSIAKALIGKNVAAAIFIFLEIGVVIGVCLLLRVRIPAAKILEAFVTVAIAALYMLSIGNLSSVYYPRPMNPERVSQGGAAGRFQALLLMLYPFALLPVFLAYLARFLLQSQLAFELILAFAALLGGAIYWIAMESAVTAAQRRREALVAELSSSEGPVATD